MASTNTLDDRRAAYIEAVVTGTGTLSFWWRVSSEPDYDEFKWIADGVEQESISGDTAWAQVSVFIDGTSTIRWVYEKDLSLSGNDDKAYLDQVIFTPQ
ncbi:MAG: hypothetical protein CVV21_11290 [Candidatus Goldiibacteriota bacterium HGW-Goldbacteria-1]|jgi:hypothetical protein|nr:MAG: hypothetical protein CVV21_11290 [Candidatus Goldiibacteriota bacterium HGW-Goldbacteria-1]